MFTFVKGIPWEIIIYNVYWLTKLTSSLNLHNMMYYLYLNMLIFTTVSASSTVWSSPLPAPVNITNADVMVECNYALYSCREGYYSNGASSYIVYDGQAWSSTAMECRRKCICLFKVILTNKLLIGLSFCQNRDVCTVL